MEDSFWSIGKELSYIYDLYPQQSIIFQWFENTSNYFSFSLIYHWFSWQEDCSNWLTKK